MARPIILGTLVIAGVFFPLVLPDDVFGQSDSISGPEIEGTKPFAPIGDLWGAAKDLGHAGWLLASSPARLDTRSAAKLGGVLLVGGILFVIDEEIQDGLHVEGEAQGLHGALRDTGNFIEPVGLQGNTNAYWAGAAVLGYVTRQDWLKTPAKQILFSHWLGGLGRQLAGRIVGRKRPEDGEGAYDFDPGNGTSFPSGHAAVAFELAYVLNHHIRWRPATVLLYGLAGTLAFQRADSNAHWMSDAWFGSAWGLLVAKTVVAADESERWEISPTADFTSGRTGVGVTFRH
jgi:hypothetical protein